MKRKCICGKSFWPAQKWLHERCLHLTQATNNASNTGAGEGRGSVAREGLPSERPLLGPGDEVLASQPRKQRWDRAAYNAYQREYMRKRRG